MSILRAIQGLSPRHRRITRLTSLSTFCFQMAECVDLNTPIADAVAAERERFEREGRDSVFERDLRLVQYGLFRGLSLSDALATAPAFPPLLTHMVRLGADAGTLARMLRTSGTAFSDEAAALRAHG